jgi:hypothetical protein
MRLRHRALVLMLAVIAWLVPEGAHAGSKLATLSVKGMVCQA